MAPKRKQQAKPPLTPTPVPKLLIKGGIEVLDLVTGPDSITQIECYLNPRMGMNEDSDVWYGYSAPLEHAAAAREQDNTLTAKELPTYSCARIALPMLNDDITKNTLLMWEAVSVKTEVIGCNTFFSWHNAFERTTNHPLVNNPVQGSTYHFFSVGGEPLDLQGIQQSAATVYPLGVVSPKKTDPLIQVLDPNSKAKLDTDSVYPVEAWAPDPSKNENTRYYGNYVGGATTPPVLTFTNTVTTILLDENGVGPLCKGDGLYLSAADIMGMVSPVQDKGAQRFRGLPRYFNVTLRKRLVKNPYPVTSLLSNLFNSLMPRMSGQPMVGDKSQVEEVRVYEGMEGLPGDPDITRYVDGFGKEQVVTPQRQ